MKHHYFLPGNRGDLGTEEDEEEELDEPGSVLMGLFTALVMADSSANERFLTGDAKKEAEMPQLRDLPFRCQSEGSETCSLTFSSTSLVYSYS
jgi:hypothetical protein